MGIQAGWGKSTTCSASQPASATLLEPALCDLAVAPQLSRVPKKLASSGAGILPPAQPDWQQRGTRLSVGATTKGSTFWVVGWSPQGCGGWEGGGVAIQGACIPPADKGAKRQLK